MFESAKTNSIRDHSFFSDYLVNRKVLDIGSGADKVVPWAVSFDMEDGDANNILHYFKNNSFDVVYSSHCLEHMNDPETVLLDWWKLVKKNGFLITIIPDEVLYENRQWPSIFNSDHKYRFSLNDNKKKERSINAVQLHKSLPGSYLTSATLQDHNFNYNHLLPEGVKCLIKRPLLMRIILRFYYKFPKIYKITFNFILMYYVKKAMLLTKRSVML